MTYKFEPVACVKKAIHTLPFAIVTLCWFYLDPANLTNINRYPTKAIQSSIPENSFYNYVLT